jgi:integrase
MASPRLSKRVLTNKAVENARPRPDGRGYEQADAGLPSFFLNVQSSGHRSFVLRYRIGGRTRKWTIGSFPQLSLEQARTMAREAIVKIKRDGYDPSAEKAASRRPGSLSGTPRTIDELVEKFLESYVRKNCGPATVKAYTRYFHKDIVPAWKGRDAATIRRADIRLLIDKVAERGDVLANRTLSAIATMFNWAVDKELVEANPAAGLKKMKEDARERVLSDGELKLMLDAADALSNPVEQQFVHTLLLTLQRRSEVAGMRWSEILDEGVWVIPGARTKNKREHRVPLSATVLEILAARPKDTAFVFPNARGSAPFADFSRLKNELDKFITEANGIRIAQWGLHDFRRTGISAMPGLEVDVVVADKALNHKSSVLKGAAATYQRFNFEPGIRKALEAWATHLAKLRADNVIDFRRRAQS